MSNALGIGERVPITCPYCGQTGPARVRRKVSVAGWVMFVVLLLVCLPLFWIPLVLDSCKEDERSCRSCGIKLG